MAGWAVRRDGRSGVAWWCDTAFLRVVVTAFPHTDRGAVRIFQRPINRSIFLSRRGSRRSMLQPFSLPVFSCNSQGSGSGFHPWHYLLFRKNHFPYDPNSPVAAPTVFFASNSRYDLPGVPVSIRIYHNFRNIHRSRHGQSSRTSRQVEPTNSS